MRKNIEPFSWQSDLAAFDKRNKLRPTRLEVLGPARDVESDFWLEDGLLLAGIDLDADGESGASIEIMLQTPSSQNHMTHTVASVKRLALETSDGSDRSLEIEDGEGKVTVMHFESERPA